MGRFKKGSQEAIEHMAKIRRKKKDIPVEVTGGTGTGTVTSYGGNSAGTISTPEESLTKTKSNTTKTVVKPDPLVAESAKLVEMTKLTDELLVGMPTKKEMDDCPPGTIHKHLNWEKRNKEKIMRWKTLRRELYPENINAANLENIRLKGE